MIKTFVEPGEMSVLNRQAENKQHCYDSAMEVTAVAQKHFRNLLSVNLVCHAIHKCRQAKALLCEHDPVIPLCPVSFFFLK